MAKLYKSHWYPIPWISNKQEDAFTASIGNYTLNVQLTPNGNWWWVVMLNEQFISTPFQNTANTKERALALCEGVYFGHISTVRNPDFVIKLINSKKIAQDDGKQS